MIFGRLEGLSSVQKAKGVLFLFVLLVDVEVAKLPIEPTPKGEDLVCIGPHSCMIGTG